MEKPVKFINKKAIIKKCRENNNNKMQIRIEMSINKSNCINNNKSNILNFSLFFEFSKFSKFSQFNKNNNNIKGKIVIIKFLFN